jgi:hypothetical protein
MPSEEDTKQCALWPCRANHGRRNAHSRMPGSDHMSHSSGHTLTANGSAQGPKPLCLTHGTSPLRGGCTKQPLEEASLDDSLAAAHSPGRRTTCLPFSSIEASSRSRGLDRRTRRRLLGLACIPMSHSPLYARHRSGSRTSARGAPLPQESDPRADSLRPKPSESCWRRASGHE